MDREIFYTYFERVFFSSKDQDILKWKDRMLAELGETEFIQNALTERGRLELLAFLDEEHETDEWETLLEFFMENAIIMMDVTGYYKYFGPNSLEELEEVYSLLIMDIHRVLQIENCSLDQLKNVLELQSIRLGNFLINTSAGKTSEEIS